LPIREILVLLKQQLFILYSLGDTSVKIAHGMIWPLLFVNPFAVAGSLDDENFDLDALMGMDVQATSAMKRAQSAFDTASSIYVLSKEEITLSGASTVPEALKLVPGLIVKKLDNNQWAITARGIASRFSSKLLVMIDGQSLYSPQFAAVYWEALNVPLYDIERIEVIRGQGGLLWGSNANNGVINIITKNSLDTRRGYGELAVGSQIKGDANLRYGSDIGDVGSYRIYGHVSDSKASKVGTAYRDVLLPPADTSKQYGLGFRTDFNPSNEWDILIQGDITHSKLGQNLRAAIDETNRNIPFVDNFSRTDTRLMARVDNRMSSTANQMMQLSWLKQTGTEVYLKEDFESIDIDYQMNFIYNDLQLDWGLSYRYNDVESADGVVFTSDNQINSLEQYGGLFQVQYSFLPDTLELILGIKADHNDFTSWEYQPSARITYKPLQNHLMWSAISRSVRSPVLLEYDYNLKVSGVPVSRLLGESTGIPALDDYRIETFLNGNDQVDSETYVSYELGYRFSDSNWSVDFSAYHTEGDNVVAYSTNFDNQFAQFYPALGLLQAGQFQLAALALKSTQLNLDVVSTAEATTKGGDLVLGWQPTQSLKVEFGYSYSDFTYDLPPGTTQAFGYDSTYRQLLVKANYVPFVDHSVLASIRVENSNAYGTDNYAALDLTWNWQIDSQWSVALSGKNLLAGSHLEFGNDQEAYTISTYIDESVALTVSAGF
jgi:iron complex outermembrane receptor protein